MFLDWDGREIADGEAVSMIPVGRRSTLPQHKATKKEVSKCRNRHDEDNRQARRHA